MHEMTLTNARLVLLDEVLDGSLHIVNGKIGSLDIGQSTLASAIDCEGDFIIPGLIELHTDNLERHIEPRPKVSWPHAAAILAHDGELASVGITTVFDAMRVGSVISNQYVKYHKYARALSRELLDIRTQGVLRISHFLHLRAEICSETLIDELDEFTQDDRVGILSIMDHTPGQRQFRDLTKLKDYACGKHGLSEEEFADHVVHLTKMHERLGKIHEDAAVATAKRLGAVLASHDDTTAEQVATSAGYDIHLAEFPTTVEAAQACQNHNIAVMMGAPNLIRGGSHSNNVAAKELAELDFLDILSSDYVPSALLTGAFQLADIWGDLPRGVATVTAAPAKATGLIDRGIIAPGLYADLVRVTRLANMPVIRGVWAHGQQVG